MLDFSSESQCITISNIILFFAITTLWNWQFAPENRPGPKRKVIFQSSIFKGENVSFREGRVMMSSSQKSHAVCRFFPQFYLGDFLDNIIFLFPFPILSYIYDYHYQMSPTRHAFSSDTAGCGMAWPEEVGFVRGWGCSFNPGGILEILLMEKNPAKLLIWEIF